MNFSYTWAVMYTFIAIGLLIFEVVSVPIKFTRKYFISIVSFIISLSVLYLLYVRQDPAQVYQFYYSTYEWKHGLHYINTILSIPQYIFYLGLIVIFGSVGLVSLTRYTHDILEYSRDEEIGGIEFNSVSTANAVFVHSVKNDLLANQVALKRLNKALKQDGDLEAAMKYQQFLQQNQEVILGKVNDMYKATRTNLIILQKSNLHPIIEETVQRIEKQYPNVIITVQIKEDLKISADNHHLLEALYNIIVNGIEAGIEKNVVPIIQVKAYKNRLFTVIEVNDNGVGIDKKDLNKIFRPYISSKDKKNNFGVGLTYVKTVVQEHNGRIHVNSKVNEGTSFSILLPIK
ncbi:MAG: HAMP domain-containing sensor histidine kinase [Solibacillus sp.]